MKKKSMKIHPLVGGMILIVIFIMSSSMGSSRSNDSVIEAGSLVEYEKKIEALNKLESLTKKDRFIKDYGTGAYLRDISETKKRLENEARDYYLELFKDRGKKEKLLIVELDLLHSIYDIVEEDNLTYQDIVNDYEDYIDEVKINIFDFYTKEEVASGYDYEKNASRNCFSVDGIDESINYIYSIAYVYPDSVKKLFQESVNLLNTREIITLLNKHSAHKSIRVVYSENGRISNVPQSIVYEKIDDLEKKYNEHFYGVDVARGSRRSYFASDQNPNALFEANTIEDRYMSAVVEIWMHEKITSKLDELGYSDRIGVYVANLADQKTIFSPDQYGEDLINLRRRTSSFLALYYCIEPGEEYDFEMLKEAVVAVQGYLFEGTEGGNTMYIKLYQMESPYRETFVKLLNETPLMENYIRNDTLGSSWEVYRTENEIFELLDCFGKEENYVHKTYRAVSDEHEVELFFGHMKQDDEY